MSWLVCAQTSKKNHAKHLCLNYFTSKIILEKHEEYCDTHEAVKIELPKRGTTLRFKNYNRSMRVPFVVYADFESFTQRLDTCQSNSENIYSKQYQMPSGLCYYK